MSIQTFPTVLIAYPEAFSCYQKFERKLSNILANFNRFSIAYRADYNDFINKHLAADNRVSDAINASFDEGHLNNISHAIIFDDGESFTDLISHAQNQGIKSRIIQTGLTKVVNKDRGDKFDIYIGRGSPWGNPHAVGFGASPGEQQNDRSEAIRKFKYDFERGFLQKSKQDALALKGKVLGCHCKPQACHGDVIAEYLNSLDDGQ